MLVFEFIFDITLIIHQYNQSHRSFTPQQKNLYELKKKYGIN